MAYDPHKIDLEQHAAYGHIIDSALQFMKDSGDTECHLDMENQSKAIEMSKMLGRFKKAWKVQTGDDHYDCLAITNTKDEFGQHSVRIRLRETVPQPVVIRTKSGTTTVSFEEE